MVFLAPSSEGEAGGIQQKANNINQNGEHTINDSSRAFGGDGALDERDYSRRAPSRSPSPYRRQRTRSPSPYRAKRNVSRSPSPFRHGRGGGYRESHAPIRTQQKRKASPPRRGRPDKRHHADRSWPGDHRPKLHQDDTADAALQAGLCNDRRPPKPLSYADNDHAPAVPDFRDHLRSVDQARSMGRTIPKPNQTSQQEVQNGRTSDKMQAGSGARLKVDLEAEMPQQHDEHMEDAAPVQETREEKRRRWAAIRANAEKEKSKNDLLHQALLANATETTSSNAASPAAGSPISPVGSPQIGHLDSAPASPDFIVLNKQGVVSEGNSPSMGSPSAADYNPTKDMLDDRDRAAQKARSSELSSAAINETDPKLLSTLPVEKAIPARQQTKKEFDMFNFDDDDDDVTESEVLEVVDNTKGTVLDEKLLDNWDDAEGYYKLIANELVNGGRYRMVKNLGRGVFANVAQAEDTSIHDDDQSHKLVAIKMIRRNDLMRKASQKEMDFVRKVNDADPQDKRHVIRLLNSFDHKGHLCAVFEHMSKNLRDLLKEDTSGHGLSLQAVRSYSRQMFVGLQHLQSCQVVHCDLKPDNILVSSDKKTIKLCDFGTAVDKRDVMERTEYLVSRFYRAPEIILGLDIGYGIDMWAIGCTIYELWTGKILFTGRTNNQMIKAFMDCLGWPTEKLLKKGLLQNVLEHFEAGPPLKFISQEVDQHGKVSIRKIEQQKKISRDLRSRVNDATRGITTGGPTASELNDFADLLAACLNFNPEKRMQPKGALLHKFFPQPKLVPRPSVVKPPMVKRPVGATRR